MSESFDLESPDHFAAGAVGPSGQRVFYLQGRERRTLVTLKCEKEQVRGLAKYLTELLEKLGTPRAASRIETDLVQPVEEVWAVGSIGVGHDEERDRIVIVASEVVEEEGQEAATARFQITRAQAAAFVERAQKLMEASRAICPMCNQPKDPGGHFCPRSNGHTVHAKE